MYITQGDLHIIIGGVVKLLEFGAAGVVFCVALVVGPIHLLVYELDFLFELADFVHHILRDLGAYLHIAAVPCVCVCV